MLGQPIRPHPGPRPALFEFPFEQARKTARVMGDVIDDLRELVRKHEAAVEEARVGFEGQTRQEFDAFFNASMGAWEAKIALLEAQLAQLEDDITRAQLRLQQSETALAEWQGHYEAWMADLAGG